MNNYLRGVLSGFILSLGLTQDSIATSNSIYSPIFSQRGLERIFLNYENPHCDEMLDSMSFEHYRILEQNGELLSAIRAKIPEEISEALAMSISLRKNYVRASLEIYNSPECISGTYTRQDYKNLLHLFTTVIKGRRETLETYCTSNEEGEGCADNWIKQTDKDSQLYKAI